MLALLVQRIIYPSFKDIDASAFQGWHHWYTGRIGQLVAPLMLIQLVWYSYALWSKPTYMWEGILWILVIFTWLDTFIRAVPLHNKLATMHDGLDRQQSQRKLVAINRPRTLAWLAILIIEQIK